LKKSLFGLTLAVSLILSSSFTCLAASTSYITSEYTTISTECLKSNTLNEEQIADQKNAATSVVKKAIKWGLLHSDDVVKTAAKYLDDDAAKIVEKNFIKAEPVLKKLLKYDTLVWQTVQDQLTQVIGRQAAIWIRYALEFLL
jgi:hydroxymethylpyrimidine/phosphomethylpyrimidine kinase